MGRLMARNIAEKGHDLIVHEIAETGESASVVIDTRTIGEE